MFAQMRCVTLRHIMQCRAGLGREREQVQFAVCDRDVPRRLSRTLLYHDMRIGSGRAERADAGETRAVAAWPGLSLTGNRDPQLRPWDVRIRRAEMQVRRDRVVLQRQNDLDETGDAGRSLGVTDIRLG